MADNLYAMIPQIEILLQQPAISHYVELLSRPLVTKIVRDEVELYRCQLAHDPQPIESLYQKIEHALSSLLRQRLQPVINATGIMIHTNLGRSPINETVWQKTQDVVCRYTNLEFNLQHGERGNRMGLLHHLFNELFGAEDALVVNNNAAALYLILASLAQGKEVLVSRGEQVQIGGGFRIPDIIRHSGALLKDVGTTNITTVDDYLSHITSNTAMVLIVHSSNYYIEGFTSSPDLQELRERLPKDVLLVVDQGSGNQETWLPGERSVSQYLQIGADLVCFSTDKMLGSTQGGVILGHHLLIEKMKTHPLMRVVRPGKVTYALLERQLIERLNKQDAHQQRLSNLANQPLEWHRGLAQRLVDALGERYTIVEESCLVGGGTTPRKAFATFAVQLPDCYSAEKWLEILRRSTPPIIAISRQERVRLLPISLLDEDYALIIQFLKEQELKCMQ